MPDAEGWRVRLAGIGFTAETRRLHNFMGNLRERDNSVEDSHLRAHARHTVNSARLLILANCKATFLMNGLHSIRSV